MAARSGSDRPGRSGSEGCCRYCDGWGSGDRDGRQWILGLGDRDGRRWSIRHLLKEYDILLLLLEQMAAASTDEAAIRIEHPA